jgi:hypothetical protein
MTIVLVDYYRVEGSSGRRLQGGGNRGTRQDAGGVGQRYDVRSQASDLEMLTVAVVAAKYFQHHLARTSRVVRPGHYLSGVLSAPRFNRRLPVLCDWSGLVPEMMGTQFAHGEVFLIGSMPVLVCCRKRLRGQGLQRSGR